MQPDKFLSAVVTIPPWYYYTQRLTKRGPLFDAFGLLRPEVVGDLAGVHGSCVINLSKSDMTLLEKGDIAKFKEAIKQKIDRHKDWDTEKHKQSALEQVDQLSKDGLDELLRFPWSPKPSFILHHRIDHEVEAANIGGENVVMVQQIHDKVPSMVMLNPAGNIYFNPQLEGFACLPKGVLEFRGKGKAEFRTSFNNFISLVRANATGLEVVDRKNKEIPKVDYQTQATMAVLRLLNLTEKNRDVETAIMGAAGMRSIILGQNALFAAGGDDYIKEKDMNFAALQENFERMRADILFAMAGIDEPSDEQRKEVASYLSINSDMLLARQRNLGGAMGFTDEGRAKDNQVIKHLGDALKDTLEKSPVLQETPALKDLLQLSDEGYIKGLQDGEKVLGALAKLPNPKTAYPQLNLVIFSAIADGLYMKKFGPVPPDFRPKSGMASYLAARLQR